jgi:hypothetical protein
MLYFGDGTIGVAELELPKSKIKIDKGKVNGIDVIRNLLTNEDTKDEAGAILSRYDFFRYNNSDLVNRIEELDYNERVPRKIRDLFYNKSGPFANNFENYYDTDSQEIYHFLDNLDYNCPLSKKLRELKKENKGPFKLETQTV